MGIWEYIAPLFFWRLCEMTKRDYFRVAFAMRYSHPQFLPIGKRPKLESDAFFYMEKVWSESVNNLAEQFRRYNPQFNEDMFFVACGKIRRPDGAMWQMDWDRGKVNGN
jgi:hypothetical protein